MKTLIVAAIRCFLIFTAVAALSIVYPASVQAVPTTYVYTGNPFTTVSGPYSMNDFVTAMVTLASPLGPNHDLNAPVTVTSFSLSDGVQTITSGVGQLDFADFAFETGPTGLIINWAVDVSNLTFPSGEITTFKLPNGASEDVGEERFPDPGTGIIFGAPGTWTTVGAVVADTGSAFSLMTLTFMALGLVARQFKRAAASPGQSWQK